MNGSNTIPGWRPRRPRSNWSPAAAGLTSRVCSVISKSEGLNFIHGRGPPARGGVPSKRFEVAFGTALQALGYSAQPVSLLPEDYRASWRKRLGRQRIELFSIGLAAICALVLALAPGGKSRSLTAATPCSKKVQAAQEMVDANDALTTDLVTDTRRFPSRLRQPAKQPRYAQNARPLAAITQQSPFLVRAAGRPAKYFSARGDYNHQQNCPHESAGGHCDPAGSQFHGLSPSPHRSNQHLAGQTGIHRRTQVFPRMRRPRAAHSDNWSTNSRSSHYFQRWICCRTISVAIWLTRRCSFPNAPLCSRWILPGRIFSSRQRLKRPG